MKPAKKLVREFCSIVTSGGTPSSGNAAYYGGEIPWLRTQEVTFNRIRNTEISISEAGLKNSAAKWIPENSVIVAMYGASAGRVAVNTIPLTTNQACCNLIINADSDFRFVYYALANSFEALAGSAKGAAQNNLNAGQVKEFEIPWFPIERQEAIADRLWQIDDLIENNRRRIKLLEEATRLIFREWFVHLRYPGHEHNQIANGVPVGWYETNIRESTEFLSRGISPSYDDDAPGLVINQKCIRDGLLDLEPARRQSKKVPAPKVVQVGDVLVNSTGAGTLGRVAQVMEDIADCTVDSHVTIVRPNPDLGVAWFGMTLLSLQSLIEGMGKGATNQTELSKTDLGEVKLVIPPVALAAEFEQLVSPLRRQTQVLRNQNVALQKGRDLLLPRLMSGEITI